MQTETIMKLRTQATSAMVNFVRGMFDEEGEVDESDKNLK